LHQPCLAGCVTSAAAAGCDQYLVLLHCYTHLVLLQW
jgi:hypothetical protein